MYHHVMLVGVRAIVVREAVPYTFNISPQPVTVGHSPQRTRKNVLWYRGFEFAGFVTDDLLEAS